MEPKKLTFINDNNGQICILSIGLLRDDDIGQILGVFSVLPVKRLIEYNCLYVKETVFKFVL